MAWEGTVQTDADRQKTRQIALSASRTSKIKECPMAAAQNFSRRRTRQVLPVVIIAAGVFVSLSPAYAINCKGEYQIVQGQKLATPYCQDGYLAKVAREYGVRVSAATIRNNPNRKAEVCRFMGFDTRVSNICADYRDGVPGFAR